MSLTPCEPRGFKWRPTAAYVRPRIPDVSHGARALRSFDGVQRGPRETNAGKFPIRNLSRAETKELEREPYGREPAYDA